MDIQIYAFYQFHSFKETELNSVQSLLEKWAEESLLQGLVILATEGLNMTISGPTAGLEQFIGKIKSELRISEFSVKKSTAGVHPFRKFKVKQRAEIVTLGNPEILPQDRSKHLSPEEWHHAITSRPANEFILLDTRNWYETRIGKFTGAVDPGIEEFQEFPEYLEKSQIAKDKDVLIYCTGGIRCEKAIVQMELQGFKNVYQLDGGILNYLERFPNGEFKGECFVFDQRVAVDQELKPTQVYSMCPHCGQPADQEIECARCDFKTTVCIRCVAEPSLQTCSKNCAHHFTNGNRRGRKQKQGYRYVAQKQIHLLKPQI